MSSFLPLNRQQIRTWVGSAIFERGEPYYRGGAIDNPRQQGMAIKAFCQGSQPQPYRVVVNFNEHGIADSSCTCPAGYGGRCKHVAALLLAWLEKPEIFSVRPTTDAQLESMSRAELAALVKRFIKHRPDLEDLLELPLAGAASTRPVDPRQVHRQIKQVLRASADEYNEQHLSITNELLPVFDLASSFLEAQDFTNAVIIYQETIQVVLQEYDEITDAEGQVADVVDECTQGLGDCLELAQDAPIRQSILHSLFETFSWDIQHGGIGFGEGAPGLIAAHATAPEKRVVAGWIRNALTSLEPGYQRENMGGLLLKLGEDTLDDEAYLRICQETGRILDLVDRLLILGRLSEATNTAQKSSDAMLLRLADLFIQHHQDDIACQMVVSRSQVSPGTRLLEWLVADAQKHDRLEEALDYAVHIFHQQPSLLAYVRVSSLAQLAQVWPEHRQVLLSELEAKANFELLTEIYTQEKEIDLAFSKLAQFQQQASRPYFWEGSKLDVKLAEAAELSHPQVAIRLYLDKVKRLIDWRGRGNYAAAASLLMRVKRLYENTGDQSDWPALIHKIRSENARLRALEDELNQAGF